MRRLLVTLTLLVFTHQSFAQEQYPPLVGPVVYGQGLAIPPLVIIQDLGSGEVWEIKGGAIVENGRVLSWSPNGCYALYGRRSENNYALMDIQKRTISEVNLPLRVDGEDIMGIPIWSADGKQLVYSLREEGSVNFTAYDLATGETEVLYMREDYLGYGAFLNDWTSDNKLIYSTEGETFEVDLDTGRIRYLISDGTIYPPIILPFTDVLRSPNNAAVASFFSIEELNGHLDIRSSNNSEEEIEAIGAAVSRRPGIEIYAVATGETSFFDLGGQLVSAATWSPDGSQLALLTWPNDDYETAHGAYLYDFETNTIFPIGDLRPVNAEAEFGYFQPSWSANGDWVTLFGLEEGWIVYNSDTETITPLSDALQETFALLKVSFSPVTHYEPSACI